MNLYDRIKIRREELGLSQDELAIKMGYKSRSTIAKIECGVNDITQSKIEAFAKALNTTPSYLMGWKTEKTHDKLHNDNRLYELSNNNIYNVPIYDSVSAGFGILACNNIVGYIPLYFKNSADVQNTVCINVKGDSMYPKIEDGDTIQVRRQTSVDSGSIAVVLLDGDEGLVKKVVYGNDFVELHSINPMYQTMRFEGAEVQRLEVVGLVKTIIKHLV